MHIAYCVYEEGEGGERWVAYFNFIRSVQMHSICKWIEIASLARHAGDLQAHLHNVFESKMYSVVIFFILDAVAAFAMPATLVQS